MPDSLPVAALPFRFQHAEVMVDAAFAAVAVSLAAEYRIKTVLNRNPAEVENDAARALALEQKPAGALPSVNGSKIGLGLIRTKPSRYLMLSRRPIISSCRSLVGMIMLNVVATLFSV